MTTTRGATCAERIGAQLAGRLEDMRDILKRLADDDDDVREAAEEERSYFALCADARHEVRYQISTGGPGDEFLATLDSGGDLIELRYRFLDWWDGATVTLTGDERDDVWEFIRDICQAVTRTGEYAE